MPAQVDSNSPALWLDGEYVLYNSARKPVVSRGAGPLGRFQSRDITVDRDEHFPMWIEAAWLDEDGAIYAWYHHEPEGLCSGSDLTAPQIGALVSYDGGELFYDLGLILTSADPMDCTAKNGFFGSGHGDFSVILDRQGEYFYFLFGNYGGPTHEQGIAIARMAFADRINPAGAVWKYFNGAWWEPGLGGRVSPIFPAGVSWKEEDTDAFWGPSVHWNTHLESYVVLMSRSCCRSNWPQEGVYITFNPDLGNPYGWTAPERILERPPAYYPQVLGMKAGETDTLAGETARLYLQGKSQWEIVFRKTDPFWEEDPETDPP